MTTDTKKVTVSGEPPQEGELQFFITVRQTFELNKIFDETTTRAGDRGQAMDADDPKRGYKPRFERLSKLLADEGIITQWPYKDRDGNLLDYRKVADYERMDNAAWRQLEYAISQSPDRDIPNG
jgi:hypothetical protein